MGSRVCALINLAMGRDHCKIFDLNAENCNLKVTVNDTQTMLALFCVIFRVFGFLFLVAQLFLDFFFFPLSFLLFLLPEVF